MKKILKYPIRITGEQEIFMPIGAEVNYIGKDPKGRVCMWAIVDPEANKEEVTVLVIGDDLPIPDEGIFIGTFVDGSFVWHVFIQP